jgi:hypothetical protein
MGALPVGKDGRLAAISTIKRLEGALRLHNAARSDQLRFVPFHGADRHHHRQSGQYLHSSGLYWIISVLGVLIFTGLTGDMQNIKETYSPMGPAARRLWGRCRSISTSSTYS